MKFRVKLYRFISYLPLALFLLLPEFGFAQYFGRNKVNYRNLDFRVLQTPHFEIYHYVDNLRARNDFAQRTEQWYEMHRSIFNDTFPELNPFILYNTHADFQQTNTISGLIGVGTGGVTEGLKNRVIMPFMESNVQTDHVLGHELVHAFQYNLLRQSDSLSLNNINNLPLWMVEGLAEYMSIGHTDVHTAIWMRDAVLHDKLPTLKDLTNRPNEFFPYRWGHAFWAFVTGVYGDAMIRRLFVATAIYGYEEAVKRTLGIDHKAFSEKWKEALRNAYNPYREQRQTVAAGKKIISSRNAGELNVVPSLSPDGKLIAFWSEKDIFNLHLYLADAATGRITERITSQSFTSHIDEFSSFESSVTWSPDSRRLAFVAFKQGRNQLVIVNTKGKIEDEIEFPGVHGFSNPAWSPDGEKIVVTGLVNGQSDLYLLELATKKLTQLTNDAYADLQPSWSPDGSHIVFTTDRNSFNNAALQHQFSHQLAIYNIENGDTEILNVFPDANNFNPSFAPDGEAIWFLSDQDGFRDLYSVNLQTTRVLRRTRLYSGITGITVYAPAITLSRNGDLIAFTHYSNDEYLIHAAPSNAFLSEEVNAAGTGMQAAMLPPFQRNEDNIVQQQLSSTQLDVVPPTAFETKPYRSKFQLDYLGNTGVGVGIGGGYGTGLAGGINGLFSDILGNHQLFGALAINGEIYDFGGQLAYINQNQRINWGGAVSHIPYISGVQRLFLDTLYTDSDTFEVANLATDLLRTFEDQVQVFASYPFSQTRRVEAGGSFARYYYRLDRYSDYFTPDGTVYIGSDRQKLDAPKGFNFGQTYVAFVGDNSQFGVASPLIGHRFRFEAAKYFGFANMESYLADYRRYFRLAPLTLATRNMFMGRYGRDAGSGLLSPLYIGYPFFIRGYEALGFTDAGMGDITINDLLGSRIFVTNAELRLPFTGPERLSVIRSRFVLTELALFTDGGIAWGDPLSPGDAGKDDLLPSSSKFIMSSGLSLRVNLFGYLIIEPYVAVPWQNGGFSNTSFGLNFTPGW